MSSSRVFPRTSRKNDFLQDERQEGSSSPFLSSRTNIRLLLRILPGTSCAEDPTLAKGRTICRTISRDPPEGPSARPSLGSCGRTSVGPSPGSCGRTSVGPSMGSCEGPLQDPPQGSSGSTSVGPSLGSCGRTSVGPSPGSCGRTSAGPSPEILRKDVCRTLPGMLAQSESSDSSSSSSSVANSSTSDSSSDFSSSSLMSHCGCSTGISYACFTSSLISLDWSKPR